MTACLPSKVLSPPPTTKEQLMKELRNLRKDTPRRQLINAIYASHLLKRPIGSFSILLFGSSGVGKSSTVNLLFDLKEGDFNAARTSSETSETRKLTEMIINTTEEYYEARDIKVAIVDSPGLNDTDGLAQDACNAYAIRKFYEEYAKRAGVEKIYPNLIAVVISATDTRMAGPNSNLAKSLRVLKTLDLVHIEKPNVIGIITFAAKFARKRNKWVEKFEEKKEHFRSIILENLQVQARIVALENYPEDEEFEPDGYGYLLPDDTHQPRNLFIACSEQLEENGDLFGHLAFTSAFQEKQIIPILGTSLSAKIASSEPMNEDEVRIHRNIMKCADGVHGSDLVELTKRHSEQHDVSDAESLTLNRLATDLKRIGIQNPQDLESLTTNGICLTTGFEPTPVVEEWLKFWGVKETKPITLDDNVLLIGHGFNLLMDRATTPGIFQYTLRNTNLGVFVPKPARFSRINQTVTFMNNFENEVELMKTRQRHLNVSLEVDHTLLEGFNPRAGFSLNKEAGKSSSNKEYSFLLEQRVFKVSFPMLSSLEMNQQFMDAATQLPTVFEAGSPDNRDLYKRFFDKWGHFVITEAYGGGSVELKISCSASPEEFEEMKLKLLASFNAVFWSPSFNSEYKSILPSESRSILAKSRIEWNGGDSQFHNHETMTDPLRMNKWKLSLAETPAMLTTDLSLAPISELVGKLDPKKGTQCYKAL